MYFFLNRYRKGPRVSGYRLIIFSFIVFAALGCSKNKDGGSADYYIRFKTDGSQRHIDYAVIQGQKLVDSTSVNLNGKVYIYSFGAANSNAESMTLGIYSGTVLTAPVTFNESVLLRNALPGVNIIYGENASSMASGNTFHNIGFFAPVPAYFPETANIKRDFVISVSEYNSTYIKGTFSGTLYRHDGNGNVQVSVTKSITEGEFKIPVN